MKIGASKHMAKSCGCRGERSCLVCERDGEDPERPAPLARHEYYQCVSCGKLLQTSICHTSCCNMAVITVPDHVIISNSTNVMFGGVLVVKEFISEERALVEQIDSSPWADSVSGRRKQVSACMHGQLY